MTENQTETLIRQLENTLRSKFSQSNWLYLEPADEALQKTIDAVFRSQQAETAGSGNGFHSATLLKSVLQSNTETATVNVNAPAADSGNSMADPVTALPTAPDQLSMDPMQAATLDSLRLRLRDCNRCNLCRERQKIVFGQGNIHAELVFIGEGPGAEEDRSGIAFVGKAGKLLTQMIHSIGINREAVYICNVVKCRPPGNRNPGNDEIATCSPFLAKQLEILKPKLIVTMGNIATKTLLPQAFGIMKMRGKLTSFQGTPLIPTFHPSYLLRNPAALDLVWNDMKQIRQVLFARKAKATESES